MQKYGVSKSSCRRMTCAPVAAACAHHRLGLGEVLGGIRRAGELGRGDGDLHRGLRAAAGRTVQSSEAARAGPIAGAADLAWLSGWRGRRSTWRAIMLSSSVGTTYAATRLSAVVMRGPCAALAASSSSHAEPRRLPQDAGADLGLVFADPRGEDDGVEATERRRQRAEFAARTIDEHVECQRRGGLRRSQAGRACRWTCRTGRAAPTRGRAASRFRAGRASARPSGTARRPGSTRSATRAHRQAVDRGEAHRRRDAVAVPQRAHARAVAEMEHDRPPGRGAGVDALAGARRCTRTTARESHNGACPQPRSAAAARRAAPRPARCGGTPCRSTRSRARPACASSIDADRREVVRLVQRRQRHVAVELAAARRRRRASAP